MRESTRGGGDVLADGKHRLPFTVKAAAWRLLDRLPTLPVRLRAGPASGLVLYAPLRYRASFRSARYEPHVVTALARHARPGMTVLDLGSHLGYHTLGLARLVGPGGRVWAFEPAPCQLKLLRRSCRRNGLSQVTPVGLAVGASSGAARLVETPLSTMSFLATGSGSEAGRRTIAVEMVALDRWAESVDLAKVDLVKLDIEGGELAALEGATRLLARFWPTLVCEVHCGVGIPYRPDQLVDRLRAPGYRVELIPRAGEKEESLEATLVRAAESVIPPGTRGIFHLLARPEAAVATGGRAT